MITTQAAFLLMLVTGILALAASTGLTRLHWRDDIPPYGRRTRLVPVLRRPAQYTREAPLRAIRSLTLLGLLGLAGAAAVLAFELVRTSIRH